MSPPDPPLAPLLREWSDEWLQNPGDVEWLEHLAERLEAWLLENKAITAAAAPSDEYLNSLWNRCGVADDHGHHEGNIFEYARAVLECCGPTLRPISAAHRQPDPRPASEGGDCDTEGRCFAWDWLASDWRMVPVEWVLTKPDYNWWLPAFVLPIPGGTDD